MPADTERLTFGVVFEDPSGWKPLRIQRKKGFKSTVIITQAIKNGSSKFIKLGFSNIIGNKSTGVFKPDITIALLEENVHFLNVFKMKENSRFVLAT